MLKVLLCFLNLCLCYATQNISKQCNFKQTCHECIKITGCAWCSQEDMFDSPRCFHPNFNLPYISDVCSEEYVYFAASSVEVDYKMPDFPKRMLPVKYILNLRIGEPMYLSLKINENANDLNNQSQLELYHNASTFLKVDFKCLNDSMKPITNCDVVKGSQYIKVKIEAIKCPFEQEAWNQDFIIYSTDTDDYVKIEIELLCSCPCEKKESIGYIPKSKKCNSVGTLKCGVCECDSAHFGKACECSIKKLSGVGCRPPGTNATEDCSGRGSCLCNNCYCNNTSLKRFTGNWCECDNLSCDRHNGKMCSGNGKCLCGKCACKPAWVGEACECSNSIKGCLNTFEVNSTICNGHGFCVCGECRCHKTDEKQYYGKYCKNCLNCESHCEELKPCLLCLVYKKGPYSIDDCFSKCNRHVIEKISVEENTDASEFGCVGQHDTCKYKFTYTVINNNFVIKTAVNPQC